jgi:phosphonate transport system substrate-binding protein
MRRRTFLTALGATAITPPVIAGEPARLAFTAIPDQDETRLVERFSRVATYLHDRLGLSVAYVPVKSYPAAVTAFINDQVQLAWFGGFTGVQARRAVPGSQAIAQGAEDARFKSLFIANTRTGIAPAKTFPDGIAGRSFTFGARASTSGRVMPEYFIRERFHKAPEQVFSRVGFSGDHTRTLALVQAGAYETGVMDFTVYDLERRAGRVDPAHLAVIWETPPFPDYNWTLRAGSAQRFGADFPTRLQAALIGCHDPAILGPFGRSGFIAARNADYVPIEQVATATGMLD